MMTIDLLIKSLLGARNHVEYYRYIIYHLKNSFTSYVYWFHFADERLYNVFKFPNLVSEQGRISIQV